MQKKFWDLHEDFFLNLRDYIAIRNKIEILEHKCTILSPKKLQKIFKKYLT